MYTKTGTSMKVKAQFSELFGERLRMDEPLARYTSARVGGSAEMFITVRSAQELLAAIELAHEHDVPFFILGGGSNILVADEGILGLVIQNRANQIGFRHTGVSVVCTAESGMNLSALSRKCISNGLGGLEWAVGIPGTVGGAVVGNSGAHGSDMNAVLQAATIWEPETGVRDYSTRELAYAYRSSVLKQEQGQEGVRRVVISAEIELKPVDVNILNARADAFNTHRRQSQPAGASMGSMFKNPEHFYAGYLIEAAGLKGTRVGGARVSEKHANFFMCEEGVSAEDLRILLAEVWHTVREQFGVELETEIELIGDWQFDEE